MQAPVVSSRLKELIIKCTKQACFQLATMEALKPQNTGKMQNRETCLQLGLLSSLIESAQIYFWVSRFPVVHRRFTWERIVMFHYSLLMVK